MDLWLRVCLPMQGTRVRFLVRRSHMLWSGWAHAPQQLKPKLSTEPVLITRKPLQLETCALQLEQHSLQLEKAWRSNDDQCS